MTVPDTMIAMVLTEQGKPLERQEVPVPEPEDGQLQLAIQYCGVCRTDLHIVDGDLTEPKLPLILGHQIVGRVVGMGAGVEGFSEGDRVGVPWLGWTDGTCRFCQRGQENLCDKAKFTGYTIDGGYAQYTVADARYCFHLPERYDDPEVAPLLCAGLIGYRTYRLTGEHVKRLGIYGFGAAAHIVAQIAVHQGKEIYAFTKPGDTESQEFACSLGAVWADGSDKEPPVKLDAAMIFAPVGPLYPAALRALVKGGTVVSGGIHMSDIPSFPYEILWGERIMRSVANLTREDGDEFFEVAPKIPVKTSYEILPLEQADEALRRIRDGELEGAAVLEIPQTR